MNELISAFSGAFLGFAAHAIVSAHKSKRVILGKRGDAVTVVTSKGERQFTLATDLNQSDEYAVLWTNPSDTSAPVTFAVKASQVTL